MPPPTANPAQALQVERLPDRSSTFSLFATPAFAEPLQLPEGAKTPVRAVLPANAPAKAATLNTPIEFRKNRTLTLVLEDVPKGAELWFTSSDGQVISPVILGESSRLDEGSRIDFPVPDFAASAFLRIETSKSRFMLLKGQEGSKTAFKVDVDHSRLGGFLKALGVQNADLLDFEIESLRSLPQPRR